MSKLFYLFVAFVCPSLLIAAPVSESFQKIVNQAAEDLNTAIKGTADTVNKNDTKCHALNIVNHRPLFHLLFPVFSTTN